MRHRNKEKQIGQCIMMMIIGWNTGTFRHHLWKDWQQWGMTSVMSRRNTRHLSATCWANLTPTVSVMKAKQRASSEMKSVTRANVQTFTRMRRVWSSAPSWNLKSNPLGALFIFKGQHSCKDTKQADVFTCCSENNFSSIWIPHNVDDMAPVRRTPR